MANFGLRTWNADGTVNFDTAARAGRIQGFVYLNGATGSVTLPDLAQGTPFFYFPTQKAVTDSSGRTAYLAPSVSFAGNVLSWNWNSASSGTPGDTSYFSSNFLCYYGTR